MVEETSIFSGGNAPHLGKMSTWHVLQLVNDLNNASLSPSVRLLSYELACLDHDHFS